ncbi:uncharacterized protein LOC129576090 [Sitodiplosis mosellana]|uniref:uncharacterized protein LOC129576090 n=1 Tax=Sitodiplosis mosellana TaxID=263140 RepID=UPI002444B91D|nr:uncharacterized protein LOC129576090 [Sitodiplosis mosellana]
MKPSTPTTTATKSISSASPSSKSKSKKSSSSSSSSSSGTSIAGNAISTSTTNQHSSTTHTAAAAQQPITVQANLNHLSNSNDHASPSSSNREKTNHRTYVGINANSVKCIWEQYNKGDIELNPEILPILAEDASYKLWEVVNNLKTFTRHSGGKLTTSIVNELLKDCNVPPIIGANAGHREWKRLDFEGTYFYPGDEVIDLREEYLRDETLTQHGPLTLEANWVSNQRNFKDLTKLWQSIMLAIVLGDDAAFQYTIHTTLINPFIGCILPHLVQKSIEYLAFGCTDDTLDRLLRFLKVLVQNYHSRDVANNEEYFNLCNLFVCLLLGTVDIKTKLAIVRMERSKREKLEKQREKEGKLVEKTTESLVKNIKTEFCSAKDGRVDGSGGGDGEGGGGGGEGGGGKGKGGKGKGKGGGGDGSGGGGTDSDKVIIKDESDYSNDVYSNYVVNPVALSIKTETPDDQRFFDCDSDMKFENSMYNADFHDEPMFNASGKSAADIKTEHTDNLLRDKCPITINGEDIQTYCDEVFSPFVTGACSDRYVDEVCKLIGYLAGKLGYFEHETTYLLAKRLEIFFFDSARIGAHRWSTHDFKWLARITQALTALGETAFRELTLYFEHIPYDQMPEWLIPHLSYGAIYIRGRKDLYFYEYMQEVCGDALLPFLLYHPKYVAKLQKLAVLKKKRRPTTAPPPLKISSKSMLRFSERKHLHSKQTTRPASQPNIDDLFPERIKHIQRMMTTASSSSSMSSSSSSSTSSFLSTATQRRIGFKFAGCCPVLTKSTSIKRSAEQQFVQSFDLYNKLNKRIVICRRKLLKPIYINHSANLSHLTDNRQYNI